jgi:hypothetical protein
MNVRCGFCASLDARALRQGSSIGICKPCLLVAVIAWDESRTADLNRDLEAAAQYEPLLHNGEELGCFIGFDGNFEPGIPLPRAAKPRDATRCLPKLRRVK